MSISKRNRAIRFVTKSFLSIILALLMLVSGFPIDKVVEALQDSKIVDQLYLSKHGSGLAKVVDNFAVKEAKANPGTRVRTVEFFAGQAAGTAGGYNENQQQNFAAQSFSMAESSVDIIDAYVELSAQIGAFTPTGTTGGKTYTGGFIYFDACVPSCSPSPAAYASVTNGLGTNSNESQTLRFRASVTSEDVIAAYTGSGASRSFAVGYCFSTGATCSGTTVANIQGVNARLVITYTYDDTSATQTNTVIYPLDSNTETGSKVASQAACTIDSNCPTFSYNAEIPEISSQLSQFFYLQTSINAATADWATQSDIGGNPGGANTSAVYFEEALSGNGGWVNVMHSGVGDYANNSSQSLEMSTNATAAYVMGGENFVTYTYPNNAATKTRTAVFPVGEVQTTGSTTKSSLVGPTVYFPENGSGTGVVDIKKAWFRVHASVGGNTTAVNLSLTHKVGGNSESGATSFSIASDGAGVSDDGYFIYVIPSSEYTELESANKTTGKDVQMSAQWITTARGAVSAELVITYTYTSETYGYLVTQNLFGGQQTAAPGTSYSTSTGAINPGIPEGTGTVTIRGVSVLANAKDGVSTANGAGGANMSTNGCTPSNTSTPVTDSEITRVMLWKSITGIVTNSDAQTYTACYSRAQNAVMSGRIIITYQWDAPPVTITVSGTLYTSANEGAGYNCSTDAGGQVDLRVAVNGGANTNGTCSSTDGTFSVTGVTDPGGVNIPVVLFISSAEGTKATTVTLSSAGASDITGLTVIIDRVVVTHQGATVMSNTYMSTADNADAGIRYSVSAGNLTVEDGMELHILDGKTFTPGGTVTTSPSSSSSSKDGDLHIDGTGTLNMGTNALSVGGDFNNEGTFTKSTGQTTTFTATATGHTIIDGGENFDSVTFNGTGGGWSFSDPTSIDVDLTVTAGTLSGTNNITVYGGDVTGNGDINLTGASGLYIEGSGNFGGNTEWDFNNLVFGDNSTSASSISTGSGNINVTGYLWVKTNHTLDAKGKTWTLSATSSVAFYLYGTLDDSTNTSTFAYTGDYSATNTLIAASTGYHNIVIDNATETFYFQASTYTLSGDLTVTAGTLINTGGPTVTVNGGDVTGNGDINIAAGTFTVDGTGNFGGNTAWDFNDLTFGDGSGAATTTASGSGAITIAGDLVVSTNQTLSGTASFNVNGGDVTGNGDINMSGSSVFTVDGTGNFGGDTAWDFNSLFFGNGSGTETTTATGSGSITTNTYLLINASHTLDAKGKTWVLAGSQSTPFFMLGTLDDSTNTSTFEFTALYGSGNVTVPSSAAYHNITINNTSESYDLGGAVTLSGDLVVTAGSINTYAAYTMTVNGGDVTGNGAINFYANGSLIVDGTGNFGGDTAWQFANLTFGDGSGVTTTTATGTGGVTVTTAMTIAASQTLDAKGKTWTLSGAVLTPLTISGTLNDSADTSTFAFTGIYGGGDVTIPASTAYHSITLSPSSAENYSIGSGTVTLSGDLTVNTNATLIGTGNMTVNGGDVTGDGDINMTSASSFAVLGTGNFGGNTNWDFYSLYFGDTSNSNTTTAIGSGSITMANTSRLYSAHTLDPKGKTWTITGSSTTFRIDGTLNDTADTSTFTFGGFSQTIWPSTGYNNITLNNGLTTFNTAGTTTLSGNLTVTAGTLSTSDNITVNGNVTGAGTITHTGGIFEQAVVNSNKTFGTSSGTNNWTFNDLKFNHASGGSNYSVTLNGGTGQIIVNGTLTIGDSGSRVVTFDNETSNDRIIDTVNFAIGSQGAFSASSSQNWLVSGTYTNTGTLTENSSTLTLDGATSVNLNSACSDYTSCATKDFYNVIINKTDASDANDNITLTGHLRVNGRLTITDGELIQGAYNVWAGDSGATGTAVSVAAASKWTNISTGDLKLGGGFDSAGVVIFNTNNGSQCTDIADDIVITSTVGTNVRTWSGAGTFTMYNVDVTDMTGSITAYTSNFTNTTWSQGSCGITIQGVVYMANESTVATTGNGGPCNGSTAVISIRRNGGTASTGFCNGTTGAYNITLTDAPSAGDTITIYLTSSMKANLVYVSDGNADTGMDLYENTLAVGTKNGGYIRISNMFCGVGNDATCYDNDQNATDMLFDATDTTAPNNDTLVVDDGVELHIRTSETFAAYGDVTTSPSSSASSKDGDVHIDGTGIYDIASADDVYDSLLSLGGDFINEGGTANFNSGSAGSGQTITFTATSTGHTLDFADNQNLQIVEFNGVGGGWSFANNDVTIQGTLTMTAGTLSSTANSIYVADNVIGTAGVINFTGTSLFTNGLWDGAHSFGPTTANTDWTFADLTIYGLSGTPTVTAQSCSTCDVTITGTFLLSSTGSGSTSTTLNAGDKIWTLSAADNADPFNMDQDGGVLVGATSTFVFSGAYSSGNVTVENAAYNNLNITGSDTFVNEGALTVGGNLTVGVNATLSMDNYAFTVTGTTDVSGTVNTITGGTGTRTFTGTLTVNDGGTFTLTDQDPVSSFGNGIVQNSANWIFLGNNASTLVGDLSGTGAGRIDFGSGIALTIASGTTTNNHTGGLVFVGGTMNLNTGNWVQGANSSLNLSSDTPFSGSGTFTASASGNTVQYTGSTVTIYPTTYYSLDLGGVSTNTGTVTVSSSLTGLGSFVNSTNATLNIGFASTPDITTLTATASGNTVNYTAAAPNCRVVTYHHLNFTGSGSVSCAVTTVNGNLGLSGTTSWTTSTAIAVGGTLTLNTSGTLTLGGDLSVTSTTTLTAGTLNHGASYSLSTGAVTVSASGVWTNTGTGDVTLSGDVTINSGTVTMNSSNGSQCVDITDDIHILSSQGGTQRSWTNTGGTVTMYNVDVTDMTGSITAYTSNFTNTTWSVGSCGFSVQGTFFPEAETGNEPGQCDGSTANLSLRVNGGTAVTAFCADTTGTFTFSSVSATAGQTITIYSTGTNKANLVYVSDGAADTGMNLIHNALVVGNVNGGATSIADMFCGVGNDATCYDNDQNATDMLFDATDAATDTLVVDDGVELHIRDTFTPTGTITTSPSSNASSQDGDFHIASGATVNMGTDDHSIGGDFVSAGTYNCTGNQQDITFTATSTGHDITSGGIQFCRVIFNGSGGGWSNSDSMSVLDQMQLIAGTFSGSANVLVQRDVYGTAGVISRSGGTFEMRVSFTRTFGPTTANTDWVFGNLLFTSSQNEITITTNSCSTCDVTVNGTMKVSDSGMAGVATILSAGDKTWTINSTAQQPLDSDGKGANSTITPQTSTFVFTGAYGSGDVVLEDEAFNNLTLSGTDNFDFEGNPTLTGDLVVNTGAVLVGTDNIVVNGGDVTGDGDINLTGGTFTINTAGNFGGTTAWDFYNLIIGAAGNAITAATGAGSVTVANVLTIDTGDTLDAKGKTWTLSGTTGMPLVINGTLNDSTDTSTFLFTGVNAGGDTTIPASTGYNNITLTPGSAENYTIGSGTVTMSGNLTINDNATLIGTTGDIYVLGGSVTGNGDMNLSSGGTFTVDGTGNFGGVNAWDLYNLTFGDGSGSSTTTLIGAGSLTVWNNVGFGASTETLTGSKDINVLGGNATGASVVNLTGGTFMIDAGGELGTGGGMTFYDLQIGDGSGISTTLAANGSITVTHNFSIGAQQIFDLSTNIIDFDVAGSFTNNGTISVGAGVWKVGGDFTNNGTMSTTGSTLELYGTSSVNINSGCSDVTTCTGQEFENININKTSGTDANDNVTLVTRGLRVNSRITITDGELIQGSLGIYIKGADATGVYIAAAGKWTNISTGSLAMGGDFTNDGIAIFNSNNGTQCTDAADSIVITSTSGTPTWGGAGTFTIYNVNASDQAGSVTAYTSTLTNTTWTVGTCGVTVSGVFYQSNESTADPGQCNGSTQNLSLRVNGGAAITTSCAASSGIFSFTSVSFSAGNTVTIYSTGANKANLVYVSDGTADTNMHLYENTLVVGNVNGGATTIANLFCGAGNDATCYDNDQNATDMLFDATDAATDTLVVDDGVELHIRDNFTPTGTVTTSPSSSASSKDGDFHIATAGTYTATNATNVGGDFNNQGTFDNGAQTVFFGATSTGHIITDGGSNFDNAFFNGVGGGWSFADSVIIGGTFTINSGTLSGNADITVAGSINATGGVINLSSPSIFEHRVGADRGFGPSTASTTWTFYTLKFTSSSGTRTVTTRSCSGCNVVVNGTLLVSESTMGGTATVLNAGDLTWSLAATNNADPFNMDQKSGSLIAGTSTFVYSGANSAGDVNIENATYNNLTLSGSDNFDFEGDATIGRALKVDTNATLIGSDNITVKGSLVGSGTVNKTSGTMMLEGAGKFAGNSGWTFNDLHIGEPLATTLPSTPTSITDCTGLQNMSNDTTGHYILANDIDCSATSGWNAGAGFVPVGPHGVYFGGEFDGQGYTISDLYINRPTTDYQGLFGSLAGASIRNVKIVNANVTGQARSGVLAGASYVSNITNVYVSGTMTSTADGYLYVGGLVGALSSEPPTQSVISNCRSDVDVTANAGTDTAQVGGLVGISQYSATIIENSIATGDVLCDSSCGGLLGSNSAGALVSNSSASGSVTGIEVGGLVGVNYIESPIVENSYATGLVTATGSTSSAGGLVQFNYDTGIIRNSYATGNVTAGKEAGGLVGANYLNTIIENSYATGTVYSTAEDTYNYIGGLVGHNRTASITDSYATGSATAAATANNNYVGGLVGENQDTATVVRSYATGLITGNTNPGGLVGNNISSSTCTNSFWDTQTSGQATSQCGTGYTTANMKTMSNFTGAGWDVVSKTNWVSEDWYMEDGTDYPRIWLTKYEATGTGAMTVNGTMKIGYGETLDAKGRTWTLAGTSGTPLVIDGVLDDTANDSTFVFAGVNGSGNTTIPASSGYHNLTTSPASAETFATTGNITLSGSLTTNSNTTWNSSGNLTTNGGSVAGAVTLGGDLAVPAGTLSGTANITVGGSASGNGTITMSSGDFSVQGTGNFGGNTNWTFNNLTLGDPINAPAGGATSITNCTELQGMSGNLSGSYVLANDIDCSATSGWNSGAGFAPIGSSGTPFTGTFDGQNYTISGLYINRPTTDYQGLFGYTGSATIKNVGLLNVNITGQARTAGLAGNANLNAVISNVYVTGNVTGTQDVGLLAGYSIAEITKSFSSGTVTGTGSDVGGLVGYFDNGGVMTDSYSTASVVGADAVGGLVGSGGISSIANSYATGDVNISSSRGGGLVGQINGTTVQKSYATGSVTGSANYDYGGLVGYNTGTSSISDSYATGNVSGPQYVGGLVGSIEANASVTRSYAIGSVSGAGTNGGLVASNLGTCTNSFWNTESSGQETSDCGTAKTTAEMKTLSTFTGASWSIDDSTAVGAAVWFIDDGVGYAHLAWEFNSDYPAISASGSGNVTVTGQLFVDSSHTLDLKGKTWTFSGSVGAPLITQAAFKDTAGTSTVVFSGASSGGNVIIPTNGTYNNLTINGSDTYQPAGSLVLSGDLATTSGTLASTQNITVTGGSVTGNGDIAQTAGTFTIVGNGTFGGDTAWEFNNLQFTNPIEGNEIAVANSETGNTSQFNGGILGNITADATAKKEGNYGYKVLFNGSTNSIDGQIDITTQTTDTYVSWWLYIPSGYSFGANSLHAMAELTSSSWGSRSFVWLESNGSGVPYGWRLQTNTNYVSSATNFSLDQWHYMELAWIKGTGANGGGRLWVDGSLAAEVLDGNETGENIAHILVGLYSGGANPANGAYIYTDSISVTNSRITSTGTTTSGSGSITANTITVGSNHELYGASKTYILTGTGTPLTLNGTFTPATSTVSYRGAGAVSIPNIAYYNLDAKPASGSPTYTLPAGTLNITNNFVVGDGTNAVTVTATTNDGPINVNGSLTISANGGVFTASDTGLLTVRGNWTNNGTFNNSGGTVKIQPYTEAPVVIGGTSVNNFHSFQSSPTSSSQNITLQFKNGSTTGFAGTLTLTGQKGQPVYIQSDSFGAQWSMNLTGTGNVTYAVIRDSACTGGDIVQSESNLDYGNNGACWKLVSRSTPNSGTSGGGTGVEGGGQGGGISCGTDVPCDNFNRANSNPIGGNWTTMPVYGALKVESNKVQGSTASANGAFWNAHTLSVDQFSQLKMDQSDGGPAVRVRTSTQVDMYFTDMLTGSYRLARMVNGAYTILANLGDPTGKVVRLEATGSGASVTLKVFYDGVQQGSDYVDTDAARLTTGTVGIYLWNTDSGDDWQGGNVVTGSTGGGSGGGGGTPTP